MEQIFVTVEQVFSAILQKEIKNLADHAIEFLKEKANEWLPKLKARLETLNVDAAMYLHLSQTEKFGHGKLRDAWNYEKDEILIACITEAIKLLESFLANNQ